MNCISCLVHCDSLNLVIFNLLNEVTSRESAAIFMLVFFDEQVRESLKFKLSHREKCK